MTKRIQRSRPHASGFTLIELLVVITILGVLSAVVVFSVRGVGDKGRDAARRTDADILRTAQEAYCAKNGSFPPGDGDGGAEGALVRAGLLSEPSTLHDIEIGDLGGCGSEGSENSSYAIVCQAGTECSAPSAPVDGGNLTVAVPGPLTGLLNPAVTSEGAVHLNTEDMFNGLIGWDTANAPAPELAETLPVVTDLPGGGQRARFTLRDDVFWHDDDPSGTRRPVQADDVEFTFEQALLRYHSRTASSLGPALGVTGSGASAVVPAGAVVAVDARTVDFNFVYPVPTLLRRLNVTEAPILPRHVYEPCSDISTVAGCPANRAPVGSGPFKFGSVSDTDLQTVKNEAYFRPGLPHLDSLTKRVVRLRDTTDETSVSEEIVALQDGSIDWVAGVSAEDLNRVRDDTTLRTFDTLRTSGGANCMSMLAFNLTAPGDVAAHTGGTPAPHPYLGGGVGSPGHKLRLAIARAFDRGAAFGEIDLSVGQPADAPISSALEASADGLPLPTTDLGAAADLLTEAGWIQDDPAPAPRIRPGAGPGGADIELTLSLRYSPNGYQAAYASAIAEELAAVGIEVDPEESDYTGAVFTRREFDLALVSYCNGEDPQVGVRRQYRSDQISPAPFSNASGYDNEDMDDLWDDAARAVDPAVATQKYLEIQQAAVNDLPYLWFVETRNTRAYAGSCTGFNHHNTGLFAETAWCRQSEVN